MAAVLKNIEIYCFFVAVASVLVSTASVADVAGDMTYIRPGRSR